MWIKNFIQQKQIWIIIALTGIFFSMVIASNLLHKNNQQFSDMAQSFLAEKLYFLETPENITDTVKVDNKYYWPLGLSPVLILIPFVWAFDQLHLFFYQGFIQLFLTLGIFYCTYQVAKKIHYSTTDALFLAFAFCFASVYQYTAFTPTSWNFVQVFTTFLIFASIYEYFGKKRYWLIGIFLGYTFMARFTAGLSGIFFVLTILLEKDNTFKQKLKNITFLIIPILVSGLLLLSYNYARFGDMFENGYKLANEHWLEKEKRFELINFGLFDIRNIPTNFYYYFLRTVQPVYLHDKTYILTAPYIKIDKGVGFFFIAPLFLYIFKTDVRQKIVHLALVPVVGILLVLLAYWWPGWAQIGPRYTLDFLPFAYLILLYAFRDFKLTAFAKWLIIISAYIDLFLFTLLF